MDAEVWREMTLRSGELSILDARTLSDPSFRFAAELAPRVAAGKPGRRNGKSVARREARSVFVVFIGFLLTANIARADDGPLPPAEALNRFLVHEDLELDQVLAEPAVRQPVFLNFDERGRMWGVQYIQYPHPAGLKMLSRDKFWRAVYDRVPAAPPNHAPGLDKITIHEDTDGDGKFDKQTTFVEGLNIATACARGRGGVWVLNPPYLLFYPDADDNDVPDGPPVVHLEGFGLEDTHSVVNSLCWGPDGWLYAAQGSTVTGNVKRPGLDKQPRTSMGQLIWRYHPESRRYEIFAEGGGNAFGVEIDSKGRIFSGHNGGDTRGFYYPQGAYLQKGFTKHGPLSNPYAFGFFPPMKHHNVPRFTHTFVIYEAEALPEQYRGKLFGVAPLLSHVVFSEIELEGTAFRTKDLGTPVSSGDPFFRPVDIKLGPDGALYIADWYDKQTNHYRNHEGQIDTSNGRIYRLRAKGAKPIAPFDLRKESTPALIDRLASTNRWERQTALRLIADRKDSAQIPELRKRLANATGQQALELLWALNLCGGLDEETAFRLLDHSEPFVRLWTIRLLGDARDTTTRLGVKLSQVAVKEPNAEVRAQLASSAKRLPAGTGLAIVAGLVQHAEDADDPQIPLLIWWAVESKCEAERGDVMTMLADGNFWKQKLVQQHLLSRLMQRFAATGHRKDLLVCAKLLTISPDADCTAQLMSGFEEAFRGRPLGALPVELTQALDKAGGGSDLLAVRQGKAEAIERALKVVADAKADPRERIQFVQVFGEVAKPAAVSVLLTALKDAKDDGLRMAILTSLQIYDDPALADAILKAYPKFSDDVKAVAQNLLASRRAWSLELLTAVNAKKIPHETLPLDVVRRMTVHRDDRIAQLVNKYWGSVAGATTAEMQQQIEKLGSVLRSGMGDPYQGKKLFTQHCSKCHTLFGAGGQIGPDLTTHKRDDVDNMLLHIVNPSAEIREGFETQQVVTEDGRTLSGFLVDRDNQVIVLRGTDGQTVTIPQSQVEEMVPQRKSLMPELLLKEFSDQQVRHLFAYLRSTQPLND